MSLALFKCTNLCLCKYYNTQNNTINATSGAKICLEKFKLMYIYFTTSDCTIGGKFLSASWTLHIAKQVFSIKSSLIISPFVDIPAFVCNLFLGTEINGFAEKSMTPA